MKKIVWIIFISKKWKHLLFLRNAFCFFYSKDGTFKQDYLKNISEFPRDFFDFKPKNNFLLKNMKKCKKRYLVLIKMLFF